MRIVVWPLGSYEYHGTHLPAETDSIIAEHLAHGLQAAFPSSDRIPVLNFGLAREHAGMPNTSFCSPATLLQLLQEILDSTLPPKSLAVLVNGHGGNGDLLGVATSDFNLRNDHRKAIAPPLLSPAVRELASARLGEVDVHAGSFEASLIAYYQNKPRTVVPFSQTTQLPSPLRLFRTQQLNRSGVIKATPDIVGCPESGRELHDAIVSHLVDATRRTLAQCREVWGERND